MKITCPNCNQEYEIDNSFLDKTVACAKCGEEFTVSLSMLVDTPPEPKPTPPITSTKTGQIEGKSKFKLKREDLKVSSISSSSPSPFHQEITRNQVREGESFFWPRLIPKSLDTIWSALARINLMLAGLGLALLIWNIICCQDDRDIEMFALLIGSLIGAAISCFTIAKHLQNQQNILENQKEIIKLLQEKKSQ